jgi:hypothetical protein
MRVITRSRVYADSRPEEYRSKGIVRARRLLMLGFLADGLGEDDTGRLDRTYALAGDSL